MYKRYLLLALLTILSVHAKATIYYVKSTGDNTTGQSWSTAFTTLQPAMNAAASGDQVWIAGGIYVPTANGTGKSVCFKLKNGVTVYGGFAGTEVLLGDRIASLIHTTNETVLSGDVNGDDVLTDNTLTINKSDNAYRVFSHVTADALDNTAILDGVTIKGGAATSGTTTGAGMYNQLCAPKLVNMHIKGNIASNGGGLYITGSTSVICKPVLDNVVISDNIANTTGGGVYSLTNSSPMMNQVVIIGNKANGTTTAAGAGGMYIINSTLGDYPVLTNVTITNNTSGNKGGGVYIWGSSPVFKNVTISGNTAVNGGGLFITPNGTNVPHSYPTLTNVVIDNNTATNKGGGLYCESNGYAVLTNATVLNNTSPSGAGLYDSLNSPKVRNSIIWGNNGSNVYNASGALPVFAYSIIGGSGGSAAWSASFGTDSVSNLDADPLFVAGTAKLQSTSPAIDAGHDGLYVALGGILGSDTCNDGTLRKSGASIDIGAYEFHSPLANIYTLLSANTINEGTAEIKWHSNTVAASFELERGNDGSSFRTVAFIGSSASRDYSVQDVANNTVHHYRLKILEKDGKVYYSNTVIVHFKLSDEMLVAPNPTANTVTIISGQAHIGQLAFITDLQGKQLCRFVLTKKNRINMDTWGPGIYLLHRPDGKVVRIAKY